MVFVSNQYQVANVLISRLYSTVTCQQSASTISILFKRKVRDRLLSFLVNH